MKPSTATGLLGLALCGLIAQSGFAASPFTTFDPAGSTGTMPFSINSAGAITGVYQDASFKNHGFVRDSSGTITTFDPTGSMATIPISINTAGAITGFYATGDASIGHGFVRDTGGNSTGFDPSGSIFTHPNAISDAGVITGFYLDSSFVNHGFARDSSGVITTTDYPTAIATQPQGINTPGTVTGTYQDASFINHGYTRDSSGTFSSFDSPGATVGTSPNGITATGAIAGFYTDDNTNHGFLRDSSGVFTVIDPADSTFTQIQGIDASGATAGYYNSATDFLSHAFLRSAAGVITAPLDPPGASNGTTAVGISAGAVAGFFSDGATTHGFLYKPLPPASPIDEINALITSINGMNLSPKGTSTSLESKLNSAITDIQVNNTALACSDMSSFVSEVKAQSGKKLTTTQAQQLTASAVVIETALGCVQ